MRRHQSALIAWSIWSVAILVNIAVPVIATRVWSPDSGLIDAAFHESIALAVVTLPLLTVGAIVAARRPRNRIGWLLLAIACGWCLIAVQDGYTEFAIQVAKAPDSSWHVWLGYWNEGTALITMMAFVFLLFPDGELPSARWRPFAWLTGVAVVAAMLQSPFGADAINDPAVPQSVKSETIADLVASINPFISLLSVFVIVGSAAAMVVRFRGAHGAERQQLKWFVYVASGIPVLFLLAGITAAMSSAEESGILGAIGWFGAIFTGVIGLPITIGIAILRYRLYDIDRLINRTLVYITLTASLLLVYLTLVWVLGGVVNQVTGEDSSLVVAMSTLAVAALLRPLRSRIQRTVDRRFYRQKYDAERMLAGFSTHLRNETDLDSLVGELQTVVEQAMQPDHVSLWLRPVIGRK
jgi:hypothetical protein